MMTSQQIRERFLEFFRERGHQILPSAPIVVKNDPTLLFTNAGMNQFKDYFLGNRVPEFKRVADTQKCLRVSGKHNDLEEVGIDTYHHTMFEMLGNWSFGDYFKKEAVAWSWELLTEVFGIPKDRLYVTIFAGDEEENLPSDEETLREWKKWVPVDRILPGDKFDNFWEMGDTGPCGPCTEIHVDCRTDDARKSRAGKYLINQGNPEVIAIWNNVFIQYNRLRDGSLNPLPAKHVDTGMGLERLVRVIQNKQSNYDTDLFEPVLRKTASCCSRTYTGSNSDADKAFRVVADHIRAICFTIADGQLPSNTGAGYVVRRILRRATRYYYSFLDRQTPLLHELVPVVAGQFATVFPNLKQQESFVQKVVFEEEEAFLRTIQSGIALFTSYIRQGKALGSGSPEPLLVPAGNGKTYETRGKMVSGSFAFDLYDTYGFPMDLTRLLAGEEGWGIDEPGFEKAMAGQKDRSRKAGAMDTGDWHVLRDGATSFTGYEQTSGPALVRKWRQVTAKNKKQFQLVLDHTPFYAESGGQVGDTGILDFSGDQVGITDTRKENGITLHLADSLPRDPEASLQAIVDGTRRQEIACHHSATHLLHAALRQILGTHVQQKGSLVAPDRLRFDFSHFARMTDEELGAVEALVNRKIRENIPVVIQEMPKEEALRMGAMALFGEKYGDQVRVITMDPSYSIELCGGTHVKATGEIGMVRILAETGIAAGVRRIEAVAGGTAEAYLNEQVALLRSLSGRLHHPKDPIRALDELIQSRERLEKQQETYNSQRLEQTAKDLLAGSVDFGGISFIGALIPGISHPDDLKKLMFLLKARLSAYFVVLAADLEGKAQVAILIDEQTSSRKKWDAAALIRSRVAPRIRGGGGGQATLATAGGQDPSGLEALIRELREMVQAG